MGMKYQLTEKQLSDLLSLNTCFYHLGIKDFFLENTNEILIDDTNFENAIIYLEDMLKIFKEIEEVNIPYNNKTSTEEEKQKNIKLFDMINKGLI